MVSSTEESEQPMSNKEPTLIRTLKSVVDLETMETISWEDLLNADDRAYNQIRRRATQSKQSGTARYVCAQCGFPVYAPLASNKRPYWKHFSGAPTGCPWWTGDPNSLDRVSARQFGGQQEGALHHKIKHLLADILREDSEASEVAVEEYVLSKEGRRKPDVSAIYCGVRTAFEIQLATTQLPVMLAKEAFYESQNIRLVWITWDFQHRPLADVRQSFLDIYFSHDENLFSLDSQSVAASTASKSLTLMAHAFRNDVRKSKLMSLREVSWNPNGLPYVYPKKDPWCVDFEKRWIPCRKRNDFDYRQEKELLLELSDRLNTDLSPDDWRTERLPSLLDIMYSLKAGRPLMTNQDNLVGMANSFLGTSDCLKFAKIFTFAARRFDQDQILTRASVVKKLRAAESVAQLERSTPISLAMRLLFPQLLSTNKQPKPQIL